MIKITAQLDNDLAAMAGRHLPFVTSLAINRTANGARALVQERMPQRFRLKRTSIPKAIKVQNLSLWQKLWMMLRNR